MCNSKRSKTFFAIPMLEPQAIGVSKYLCGMKNKNCGGFCLLDGSKDAGKWQQVGLTFKAMIALMADMIKNHISDGYSECFCWAWISQERQ